MGSHGIKDRVAKIARRRDAIRAELLKSIDAATIAEEALATAIIYRSRDAHLLR